MFPRCVGVEEAVEAVNPFKMSSVSETAMLLMSHIVFLFLPAYLKHFIGKNGHRNTHDESMGCLSMCRRLFL